MRLYNNNKYTVLKKSYYKYERVPKWLKFMIHNTYKYLN